MALLSWLKEKARMLIASPNVTAAVAAAEAAAAAAAASATAAAASATLASTYASDSDGANTYNTKADVEVATVPATTLFVRTAGYTSAGDYGGALYARVTSEPSHAGKIRSTDRFLPNGTTDNTNGGWWAIKETILTPQMFGAKGDSNGTTGNGTDDYQAIMNAIGAVTNGSTGPTIWFPPFYYRVGTTIELKKQVRLVGNIGGMAGGSVPRLMFDTNVMGIIIQRYNTTGSGVENPTTTGADATIIDGLILQGAGTDQTKHGIWFRARATVRNCVIGDFGGNGIHISAAAGGGGSSEGNANCWRIETTRLDWNGLNGLYVDGPDVNAGTAILVDATANGRWGIYDSSFLGNTYVGCHTEINGTNLVGSNSITQSSTVSYDGNRYWANPAATEAQYVATTPGTNENVWLLQGAGGVGFQYVEWLAAQPEGTYFAGGAYRTEGAVAANVLLGCYSESGQGPSTFDGGTISLGGMQAAGTLPGSAGQGGDHGNISFNPLNISGLKHRADSAPPTTGTWTAGDITWSTAVANRHTAGWRCTATGTPGTWVAFGRVFKDYDTGGASDISVSGETVPSSIVYTFNLNDADCTVTLGTTGIEDGIQTTISRMAGGPFSLLIGAGTPLTTLAPWEWCRVVYSSTAGAWRLLEKGSVRNGFQQTVSTDADFTLKEGAAPVETLHTGTLTQDRAVTLSTTNATQGKKFRITRTGGGAFNLNVGTGPLKALATGTWCEVVYDGSAWYLAAYGAL